MRAKLEPIQYIITIVLTILVAVATLWYYGYLNFSKPEDASVLKNFTLLKAVPGTDVRIKNDFASQEAKCINGILMLFDRLQKGADGLLLDSKNRPIRCLAKDFMRG